MRRVVFGDGAQDHIVAKSQGSAKRDESKKSQADRRFLRPQASSAMNQNRRNKYSLRGSSPRPMAHKTIALTTELRELGKIGERVRLIDAPFLSSCKGIFLLQILTGTWCSGITSAPHAEGPGFKSQCVQSP